ncbi:MAG: PHP domain-containing protein [Methanosarcinales archaeon]
MSFFLDLHIHTFEGRHKLMDAKTLNKVLNAKNLDGVAITDHDYLSNAIKFKKQIKNHLVILGEEISSSDGHILAIGIQELVPSGKSTEETIEHIHDQDGIAIAPHPYYFEMSKSIWNKVKNCKLDAIEVYNGLAGVLIIPNYLSNRVADKLNLPKVASTDAHELNQVGTSYTEILAETEDKILEKIKKGATIPYCNPVPFFNSMKSMWSTIWNSKWNTKKNAARLATQILTTLQRKSN